jgi:hypothetical protein
MVVLAIRAVKGCYACFGSKEALFRQTVALYGTIAGQPPRRALREQPTARAAIEAWSTRPVGRVCGG